MVQGTMGVRPSPFRMTSCKLATVECDVGQVGASPVLCQDLDRS